MNPYDVWEAAQKRLVEGFVGDLHTRVAADVLGIEPEDVTPEQRREAKVYVFGWSMYSGVRGGSYGA